jgi:hypothetical protein
LLKSLLSLAGQDTIRTDLLRKKLRVTEVVKGHKRKEVPSDLVCDLQIAPAARSRSAPLEESNIRRIERAIAPPVDRDGRRPERGSALSSARVCA